MVDLPGTQRHSARRGTLSFRPASLAAAVNIIDLPCPDPNPASPRTAPSAACPCRRKQSAAVATRAHQRAEVEKRDLGPVGSVPMTTVARQGNAQRCACTSPCVCSKGCKTVIIERPYESLETPYSTGAMSSSGRPSLEKDVATRSAPGQARVARAPITTQWDTTTSERSASRNRPRLPPASRRPDAALRPSSPRRSEIIRPQTC
jgi:hypothetical protein